MPPRPCAVKLNAPCCLSLSQNSSHHRFTWRSTYEASSKYTALTRNMRYQLRFYTRGQGKNVRYRRRGACRFLKGFFFDLLLSIQMLPHDMTIDEPSCSVSDLVPGAEYGARVRSSPNQSGYRGQWSDWSAEIHWKTERTQPGESFLQAVKQSAQATCVFFIHRREVDPVFFWTGQRALHPVLDGAPPPPFLCLRSNVRWAKTFKVTQLRLFHASETLPTPTGGGDVPTSQRLHPTSTPSSRTTTEISRYLGGSRDLQWARISCECGCAFRAGWSRGTRRPAH